MLFFAPGTQFQIKAHGAGSFNPVPRCIGVSVTGWERDESNVTGKLDGAHVFVPGQFDPGTLTARFLLDDKSGMHAAFTGHLTNKTMLDIKINVKNGPDLFSYTGWVRKVSGVDFDTQSSTLVYTVEFRLVIMDK